MSNLHIFFFLETIAKNTSLKRMMLWSLDWIHLHKSAAQSKQKESPLSVWEDVTLSLSLSLSLCPLIDRAGEESQHPALTLQSGPLSLMRYRTSRVTGPAEGHTHQCLQWAPGHQEHWHWFTYRLLHTHTHTQKPVWDGAWRTVKTVAVLPPCGRCSAWTWLHCVSEWWCSLPGHYQISNYILHFLWSFFRAAPEQQQVCYTRAVTHYSDENQTCKTNETKAAFQIAYFFFLPLVRTAAALTKYVLLHTVCIQLGHTTS